MSGVKLFKPNDTTQKAFGDALRKAEKSGVKILAYDSKVEKDTVIINNPVKIELL